ncbi:helix-turn-helix domain-containing protein [Streptomyces sp. So13.3]|uniref:helix-turn-helix domain-containing protein n=2 Tax=Streptomyces TaxID=1883 RepID=UPI001105DF0E|nr:helix-turn-helix domain-containing protein [Streptomyces fildesensis]QNA73285.1 helix-turn-helix domain-containing protein [Streptomyces sp. So13.3]QNA77218.1 helix-turn-helix domain-containing protein [Streptomyces sp. So13.3]
MVPTLLRARPASGPDEALMIDRLTRARKAPADLVLRAQIIVLSWDGLRVAAIAVELGCHAKTVRWWLHRFNELGVEGLEDRPVAGRPRRITEAERSRIIALVRQEPPGRLTRHEDGELAAQDESGAPQWTLDALAEAARRGGIEVGRSQVRRILVAEGVRWRRTRSWIRSKDRDFEGKGRGSSASTPARPKTRRSSASTSSDR